MPEIRFPASIQYRVSASGTASISYLDANQNTETDVVSDSTWSYSFDATSVRPLHFFVQFEEGTFTVEMFVDSALVASKTTEAHENIAGLVQWVDDAKPRVLYSFNEGSSSILNASVSLRSMRGTEVYNKEDITDTGLNGQPLIIWQEIVEVGHNLNVWMRPVFTIEDERCPLSQISYVDESDKGYLLSGSNSCESGYTIEATTPEF